MSFRYYLPSISWALIILYLCAIPGSDLPQDSWYEFPGFDKCVHLSLYLIFEWLILWGFSKKNNTLLLEKNAIIFSLLISISYGGIIELLQGSVFVERSSDIFDFIANTCGALLGLFLFKIISSPQK